MSQPSSPPASPSPDRGPTAGQHDWAAQAADQVETFVATVRERTTTPVLKAARGAIWGTLATFLVVTALVLLYTIILRMLVVYLPGGVWVAHLVLGVVFSVSGVLIALRGRVADDDPELA